MFAHRVQNMEYKFLNPNTERKPKCESYIHQKSKSLAYKIKAILAKDTNTREKKIKFKKHRRAKSNVSAKTWSQKKVDLGTSHFLRTDGFK